MTPVTRKRKSYQATGTNTTIVPAVNDHLATAINKDIIPRVTRASSSTRPRCLHFATSHIEFEHKCPDHFFSKICDNIYNDYIVIPLSNHKRNIDGQNLNMWQHMIILLLLHNSNRNRSF